MTRNFMDFRGRSCSPFLAILLLNSHATDVARAFEAKTPPRPTRRDVLAHLSLLTVTNVAIVQSKANPSFASDEAANANADLSLAKPMGPDDSSRPSAPLEYLLPAARVGVYIYQALSIAEEVSGLQQEETSSSDSTNDDRTSAKTKNAIARLDTLLLSPPQFIQSGDPPVSRGDQYGKNSLPIVGEIGIAAQKQKERRDQAIEVGLAPQFFEVGNLVGERRQWNQLQKAERKREGASEIRRAFNIYTTNLNFSRTKYQWVGSTDEKSRRIRNDKLPTTTDVIRSDLDARDLYRNQVQTALDDARAEWMYQMKESSGDPRKVDVIELLEVLKQAQVSVDKWFGFIPDRDVQLALEAVGREQKQT